MHSDTVEGGRFHILSGIEVCVEPRGIEPRPLDFQSSEHTSYTRAPQCNRPLKTPGLDKLRGTDHLKVCILAIVHYYFVGRTGIEPI